MQRPDVTRGILTGPVVPGTVLPACTASRIPAAARRKVVVTVSRRLLPIAALGITLGRITLPTGVLGPYIKVGRSLFVDARIPGSEI